ncbi:MAG: DinB family protein [Cyclobacteriaceae bacterium]|nr:DinB family protein [Cyclobacteriaceae bacterium]
MNIKSACCNILSQLKDLIVQISDQDYIKPVNALNSSTIGQHLRHTLEFFTSLESGVESGVINYDRRAHDKLIENDRVLALSAITRILEFVDQHTENPPLILEAGYDLNKEAFARVETNYQRELVYNIEHAIHHMAIIKIGIREVAPYINLPRDFGIAASTIRYQDSVAASH